MKSLGTRLAIIIFSILLAIMLVGGLWIERQLIAAMKHVDIEQAEMHAKTLAASLKTLMLNGNGTLAREWLNRLHGVAGIVEIEVLRRDGTEAFSDLKTIEAVNNFLGEPRFQREVAPPRRTQLSPQWERVQSGNTVFDLSNPERITLAMPIEADVECMACHGYDPAPFRGVLHLSLSTAAAQERIRSMRFQLWMSALLVAGLLAAVMWLAMRYSVLKPIARLREAIARAGRGERTAILPVVRADELGEVAAVFNHMQKALRMSETRVRVITDNVVDGIVTIFDDGIMESLNPAAEHIFGYAASEVVGQHVGVLTPEPYRNGTESFLHGAREDVALGVPREIYGKRKNGTVFPMDVAISEAQLGERRLYISIVRDITNRKAQTAALKYQALHDSLTDLPNRALLYDRLQQSIRVASRENRSVALIIMDLDRFKEVNDTLGHQVGDKLLQQVAQRLRLVLRESDTVARLGGDEFSILLPGADAEQAVHAARKVLKELDQPFVLEGQHLEIGASLGISLYPQHGEDAVVLMQRADVAMYVAKRANRGFAIYDAEQDQHSIRQLAITGELRLALDQHQLRLHYQPKIDLDTRAAIGIEALIRWHHPVHGLMLPEEFVPLAEQTGLIRPLTLWVLRYSLQQCTELLRSNAQLSLSVNLSMRNLHDGRFIEEVGMIVGESGLAPARLRFEITETALMAEPDYALRTLHALKEMGFELTIDDFGTGYSSLAYLKQMPVSELKIDKSFVIALGKDDNSAVIVRSTVDLAHKLGLQVVAEGVEHEDACRILRELECDAAQGYFVGKPMPVAELTAWLEERRRGT